MVFDCCTSYKWFCYFPEIEMIERAIFDTKLQRSKIGMIYCDCLTIHRYPIFSTRYSVMCKVYTGYHGISEIEHGLCAGPRSAICRAPDSYVRGPELGTRSGNILSFLLPLFQEGQLSYWRKYVHEVLVNRLGGLSLPRKSVVRLTDRPDMTLDVYRGRKTSMQQCMVCAPVRSIIPSP